MAQRRIPELYYRLPGRAAGAMPGAHRSGGGEGGFEFRGQVPLASARDLRRLDLHASLRDPFGQWIVRQYSLRLAVPVLLLADVSASMAFAGQPPRQQVLADLAESLAASAWRQGDSFGLVACDSRVRTDLLLPPTRARGAGSALAARLRALVLDGASSRGLLLASRYLPQRRSWCFWCLTSTGRWPICAPCCAAWPRMRWCRWFWVMPRRPARPRRAGC